jgi:hypothetical protein
VKKYISIILGMLLVFGFAASAFAMHTDIPSEDTTPTVAAGTTAITLSGEVRARYDFRHVGLNSSTPDTSFANERMRLGLEAKVSPNTTGMIQITSEGDPAQADVDNLIAGTGGTANALGYDKSYARGYIANNFGGGQIGNEFKGQLTIRQLWINHEGTGLLGLKSGLKIGHMPLILGTGLFFDHSYYGDDALLLYMFPSKEIELDFATIKFTEGQGGTLNLSNESNAYVLMGAYKPSKDSAVSADITYVDAQNIGHTSAANTTIFPNLHLFNFALRGNTVFEGFRLKIDGEFQTGMLNNRGTGNPSVKPTGYAVATGVGYTFEPVKLDLEFAYGSGDNGKANNKAGTFITTQGPESTFGDPYRAIGIQGPYVYNYRIVNAANNQFGGLQNTWYLRLGGNMDASKAVNLDLAIYYLRAAQEITATNVGVYGFSASNVANKLYRASTDIGTEVDGRVTYKFDRGVQTWIEGGYLWAGDFWKAAAAVAPGQNPVDCYTLRTGIQLNF